MGSKALVINRRLVYMIGLDGSKKVVTDPGEDCPCCTGDDNTPPPTCTGPCKASVELPWMPFGVTPDGTCCFPKTLQVKLNGASGPCVTENVSFYNDDPEDPRIAGGHQYKVSNINITGCIQVRASTSTGGVSYYGTVSGSLIYEGYWTSDDAGGVHTPTSLSGCDAGGHTCRRIFALERAQVAVIFTPPTMMGEKWRMRADVFACSTAPRACKPGSATAANLFVFDSFPLWSNALESIAYLALAAPFGIFNPGDDVDPCFDEATVSSVGDGAWFKETIRGIDFAFPHASSGSLTVKPCCDLPEFGCDGKPIPATVTWYACIYCGGAEDTTVWAREDWITWSTDDPDKSVAYRDEEFSIVCFYYSRTHSGTRTVPSDPEPALDERLHSTAIQFDTCALCASSDLAYIQARDCDGNALLPIVVANNTDVLTDGTAYVLPGTCMTFDLSDATDTIPSGAELVDINDYTSAESCETCSGSTPCPTDNSGCPSTYVGTFTPHGDCGDVTAKAGTLTAKGDGTWRYSQYPDTEGDDGSGITLLCSGEYYYAIVSDVVEAGGYNVTYRKLRTVGCPRTGTYEFFSATVTGCSLAGSTFSLAA